MDIPFRETERGWCMLICQSVVVVGQEASLFAYIAGRSPGSRSWANGSRVYEARRAIYVLDAKPHLRDAIKQRRLRTVLASR
jgi:hypothetical protein